MVGTQEHISFPAKSKILRGREGINLLVHACRSNSLSFSLLLFIIFPFFLSFFFFFLNPCFYFLTFKFSILWCLLLLLCRHSCTRRGPLYSAYRDRILLFQPLTTFVWSRCTGRPPLVQLCVTPHRQTKESYYVCLSAVTPFLATVWVPSLSLSLMACTQWFQLNYTRLGGMSSQQDTSPKKALVGTSKIGFPLSPPPNHALLPLTHDLTVSCIGQVQVGEVWALRVPLFHVCPKSACCSCVCRG